MDQVADIVSWTMIVIGGFVSIVGGIGMLRLPDFFTRLHAASLTDTLGMMLMLGGLIVQAIEGGVWMSLTKLFLIMGFILFTSPISTHALAGAALRGGERPRPCDDRVGLAKGGVPVDEPTVGEPR